MQCLQPGSSTDLWSVTQAREVELYMFADLFAGEDRVAEK